MNMSEIKRKILDLTVCFIIATLLAVLILCNQITVLNLIIVTLASISGIEISDRISEFVVTMTKKQKRTLFRKLFICGALLFLIGSVFSIHSVDVIHTSYSDDGFSNGIGFKLCFLNKQLTFSESSVWYILLVFILGVFRLIGLTFVAETIVLGLRDNLQEHRCIKKQKWMLFICVICGLLLILISSVFCIVTKYDDEFIHYPVKTYELLFLNKPFISGLSLQWSGFFDFILGALRQLGLIFAIVPIMFSWWEYEDNEA
jgi:hypothetical protein